MNYYNENDPKAAAWLRELIKARLIPAGDVDERSIVDVKPHELTRYTQQHFFAGIGGWSLALKLAGWPDSRPVRTGSCPCQPFSAAGKQLGTKDERHLWPVFRDLITFGEPTVTFGEQVASALGREWLAGIRADLEGLGYEVGAADLCASSIGTPHIRQRLFWVANPIRSNEQQWKKTEREAKSGRRSEAGGLADTKHGNRRCEQQPGQSQQDRWAGLAGSGEVDGIGNSNEPRPQGRDRVFKCSHQWPLGTANMVVLCEDGKARRFEPGSFPLAHGIPGRVGLLRGYGNAIVPQLAAEFIQAAVESLNFERTNGR